MVRISPRDTYKGRGHDQHVAKFYPFLPGTPLFFSLTLRPPPSHVFNDRLRQPRVNGDE